MLARGREELRQFGNWRTYLMACGQGFLLYPVSLSIQALIWSMMIKRAGHVDHRWRDVEIYAYTHLMRHIPGAFWYLAGRTAMYYAEGIGASIVLASSGLEWLLLLVAAVVTYSVLSLPTPGSEVIFVVFILAVIASLRGCRFLYSIPARHWLLGFIRRRLEDISMIALPRWGELILWIGLYIIAYGIGGLILFSLIHGVAPTSDITLSAATRIWALAGGIGFLTSMVVPAGIGIRELTLTALLAPDISTVGALLVALLLRMLFMASDLVWGGLMWAIARIAKAYLQIHRKGS